MADRVVWDSPGGLAEFAPRCTCGHPLGAHNQHTSKRACSTWTGWGTHTEPVRCPCKSYDPDRPETWPPPEVQERLL